MQDHLPCVGELVKAKYYDGKTAPKGCSSFRGRYYAGIIHGVCEDGSFEVVYEDSGAIEDAVVRDSLKFLV